MNEKHRARLESMARAVEKMASISKDEGHTGMIGLLTLEVSKLRWTIEELAEIDGKKVEDI